MKIAIISGSVRKGRKSHQVAIELQKRFIQSGYLQTVLIDLAGAPLPVLEEERYNMHPAPTPAMIDIHHKLNDADAIIFLSPEYHGGYTGALKNAVDYYWSEFQKKPIGVVATSSGRFGGINTSTQLQQLVLALGAYPMPLKLLVPTVQLVFDDQGVIKDELISKNIDKYIAEFTWFADAIVSKKHRATEKENSLKN
jgi:azobenzene reductase